MYTIKSRVRYSEVTKNQALDLYAILNYFQDCSNFQSADLGVGVQYLTARSRAWLLSAWQVELVSAPRLFDPISVGTWPYDFKGMYGYRNFILYNEAQNHEVAAYANSIWFLVDTKTGRPLRVTPEDAAPYKLEPAYAMDYAPRKISLPKHVPDGTDALPASDAPVQDPASAPIFSCPPVPVTKMFLDTNNHVNNAQYVNIAQSCLPDGFRVRRMRAEYRRAAVLGDTICPVRIPDAGQSRYCICLNGRDGDPYAVVEFTAGSGSTAGFP